MKNQRYEYKRIAKDNLVGKYSIVIPIMIVLGVIQSAITSLSRFFSPTYTYDWETFTRTMIDPGQPAIVWIIGVLSFVVSALFVYGTTKMYIQTAKNEKPVIEDIITVGVKEQPIRTVVLQLLINIFVLLWTLLFIIPGIIKSIAYSMSFYLIHRKPELSATEAIDESKKLTRGKKMDLFLLDLSYLGWYILGIFTLCILWFWIIPKHQTARTLYFNEIFDEAYPKHQADESDTE